MRHMPSANKFSSSYASSKKTMKKTILGKEINLSTYSRWSKTAIEEKLTSCEFVKFVWVDLNQKNPDDDEFTNAGVRSEQNTEDSVPNMQFSLTKNGWDDSDLPPVVDVDGKFQDGRTRALALMAEGERWCPAVQVILKDKSKSSTFANGLRLNFHAPRRRAVQEDFTVAGVELIRSGELNRNIPAIESWLFNKVKIDDFYPNNAGGSISKIVNAIYDRTENGGDPIVRKLSREQWLDYLETSSDMVDVNGKKISARMNIPLINDCDFVLYDAPSSTNESRLLSKILQNASKGIHTYFVLYANNEKDADYIRSGFKAFLKKVETYHASIVKYANNSVNFTGIDLTKMNTPKLYTCLGVLPQLFDGNGHEAAFKAHRIISVDQF
jgi:hypothetical protein